MCQEGKSQAGNCGEFSSRDKPVSVPFVTGLILFLTCWLGGASRARGQIFVAELFQLFTSK